MIFLSAMIMSLPGMASCKLLLMDLSSKFLNNICSKHCWQQRKVCCCVKDYYWQTKDAAEKKLLDNKKKIVATNINSILMDVFCNFLIM